MTTGQKSTDAAISEIADYLTNAARLVACINDLQIDKKRATSALASEKSQQQLVYLIDTNAVLFALRPRDEASQTSVFRHSESKGNSEIAALTAYLIKSGSLAGQNNAPLYMARDHLGELSRKIEKYLNAVRGAAKHFPVPEDVIKKGQLLLDFNDLRKSGEDGMLHAFEGSPWSAAIRQAQKSNPAASAQTDPRELVEQITRVVLRAHENNQASFSAPIERNIRSDARVILDIAAANRAYAKAGPRFCLLTADRYLHVGVSSLFYSDDAFNKLCAGVDPVRHVLQLLPHFNLPLNDPIESPEQFKSAYEELLDAFGYHKSRPNRRTLHFYAMAAFSDFHPQVWVWMNQIAKRRDLQNVDKTTAHASELEALLRVVRNGYEYWRKASEKTLEANGEILKTERDETAAKLKYVRRELGQILDDYEAEHFNLLLSYYCWNYFESIKKKNNRFAARDARIVLAITHSLGDLTNGNSISAYLDDLNVDEPDDLVPDLIERLKRVSVSDRRLLIGCLALVAEVSDANVKVAHDLFMRVAKDRDQQRTAHRKHPKGVADVTFKGAAFEVDLYHLLSMTSRLIGQMHLPVDGNEPQLSRPAWLDEARRHCDRCEAIAQEHDWEMELLRARNQRAAIHGTHIFSMRRQSRGSRPSLRSELLNGVNAEDIVESAGVVREDLTACWKQLSSKSRRDKVMDQVRLSKSVDRDELLNKIEMQIYNNVLAYSAMQASTPKDLPALESQVVEAALTWMERFENGGLIGPSAFSVELINYLAICHVSGRKPQHGATASSALKAYLQRVEHYRLIEAKDGSQAKLPLHESDIDELRFFASSEFLAQGPGV